MQWVDMAVMVEDVLGEGIPEVIVAVDLAVEDPAVAIAAGALGAGAQVVAIAAGEVQVLRGLQVNTGQPRLAIGRQAAIRLQIKPLQHGERVVLLQRMAIQGQKQLQRRARIEQPLLTVEQKAKRKRQPEARWLAFRATSNQLDAMDRQATMGHQAPMEMSTIMVELAPMGHQINQSPKDVPNKRNAESRQRNGQITSSEPRRRLHKNACMLMN